MDGDQMMRYNFASLDTLAGDIDTRVNAINTTVEDLRKKIDNLTQLYQGSASDGFNATRAKWNGAANDLNAVLARISVAVKKTREDAHATEAKNTSRW